MMTRRCTRVGGSTLAFVGDAEQGRLLRRSVKLVSLDGRFVPELLLCPLRELLDKLGLDGNVVRPD
jgi:hypothetical protein